MYVLEVKNLTKSYKKTLAVDHINFTLKDGEVTILAGPNGAGKTTTIKSILGLLKKNDGEVLINGEALKKNKNKIAYIPETPEIYSYLTVWEHMKFIAFAYGLKDWEKKSEEILNNFNILDKKDEFGQSLSKGMRQKVSISMALLHDPEIFFVDEPFIGLDPIGIKELKESFKFLRNEGKTILISTHMLALVEEIGDNIIIMKKGNIIFSGNKLALKEAINCSEDESLEDLFVNLTTQSESTLK